MPRRAPFEGYSHHAGHVDVTERTSAWQLCRAQVYHNFMTPEECDHIVSVARPMVRHLKFCCPCMVSRLHSSGSKLESAVSEIEH